MKKIFLLLIVLSFVGMSCASIPRPWENVSGEGVVSNRYFKAWIKPAGYDNVREGYRAFLLTVQNKTDDVIVLDWNVSRFINNDRENGGFIFAGVLYSMKDDPKAPDLITANSKFNKVLLPLAHLESTNQGWQHMTMKQGRNGMLLAVIIGDKLIKEKIMVNLTKK